MSKQLVILGGGGHGRVVAESAELSGLYDNIVFLDDKYPKETINSQWSIVGELDNWSSYIDQAEFIVAIGINKFRLAMTDVIADGGGKLATVIHPTAVVSQYASIDAGTVVCANSTINIGATIGRACIINTNASVDHDCAIADGVHVSPGSNIAGQVTIKQAVWVGIGATINECLTIGENTIIGGGASVIHDAEANSLYVGVPANKK